VKRTLVAVALAVIFMLALASPAFAIVFTTTYEMEGTINFKKQAGHVCNTGAEFKQTIAGSGKMDKVMDIAMVPGKLTVSDVNNWVAGATPLTVTSVWELCTPAKYTYEDVPVSVSAMYGDWNVPAVWHEDAQDIDVVVEGMVGTTVANLAERFGWEALTNQIWAVQVQADPGFSGNLSQTGEAAYGPYATANPDDDQWTWDGNDVELGDDFVGDYFTMEQHARTSQGTLRRYIDVSSPWSHAYLHEDMSVVGKSDVKEAFSMKNLASGQDVVRDWWRLF